LLCLLLLFLVPNPLQGCHPATCMADHLSTAAHRCGGKLHRPQQQHSKQGLAGSLALPGVDTPLDLSQPAARLFGIELAGLQGSSQQELDALKMQQQQDDQVGCEMFGGAALTLACRVLARRPSDAHQPNSSSTTSK
jgi:hypothetical protein